jgi:predicted permease
MDLFFDKLRAFRARLRYYLFRAQYDREMDEEMRFHLDLRAAEHKHDGLAPNDARDAALRRFGNRTRIQERRRAAAGSVTLETMGQDLRYVVRALARSPGFSGMVVLTLALGIGANAAMFGIIDRLLLRGPEHVVDADRVVRLYATQREDDAERVESVVGYVAFAGLRDNTRAFERLAAYAWTEETVGRGLDAERIKVGRASWDFFPLLGVRPVLGRFFGPDEDKPPRGADVVVLEEGYWERMFGGDRGVIGRTIDLGGATFTIIGVAPRGFTGAEFERRDAWVPISVTRWGPGPNWPTAWDVQWLQVIGRLKPSVGRAEANADATAAHARAYDGPPNNSMRTATFSVAPLHYNRAGRESTEAAVARWLVAVAAIVLVIACANVANLFLARALRRRREVAVRLALGISRGRLIRLLLLESLALGIVGGAAGLAIATAGGRYVRGALLPNVQWTSSPVDARVLAITALAALVTGIVIGLLPAIQATRPDVAGALKAGARDGGQRMRLRSALTIMQAALSVVLLVGAGLFVRSLRNVRGLDLGIQPDRVLIVSLSWPRVADISPEAGQRERTRRAAVWDHALERVRELPGVDRAAVVVGTPFQSGFSPGVRVAGRDSIPKLAGGGPFVTAVSSDYFATAGTRLLNGRVITATDRADGERVAVINETMARTLWPTGTAIGQCLVFSDTLPCSRIVGIVQNARRFQLREPPAMQVYIPLGQERALGFGGSQLLVRPARDAGALTQAIRREVLALDPGVRYVAMRTMQDVIDPQVRPWKLGATMFSVFGVLALAVAAVGLYSVIAYLVSQRTRELGVRIALGAQSTAIARLILGYGLGTASLGLAMGIGLALLAGRWVEPLLFDATPRDPIIFTTVVAVLLVVATVASLVPAWRAARVDPIEALRAE